MRKAWPFLALLCLLLTGCRVRMLPPGVPADTYLTPPATSEPEPVELPEQPEEPEQPEQTPEAPRSEKLPPAPQAQRPEPLEEAQRQEPAPEAPIDPNAQPTQPDPEAAQAQPAGTPVQAPAGAAVLEEEPSPGLRVTYDPNGGDGAPVSTTVQPGQPYGPQPAVTRAAHSFSGWWTEPEGGAQVLPETVVTAEQPHTLYAHWQKKAAATVTFDGNGGRVKAKDAERARAAGDALGELPTPLREGYTFLGWFSAPEGGEQALPETVCSGEDLTLYAQWQYDPFAFWTFTLQNRTQQVYLCQQAAIYFESAPGVTARVCPLITATGSQNVAENRDDPNVTDDWVLAKKPAVVLAQVAALPDSAARASLSARFPSQRIVLVTQEALSDGAAGLYARLALAQALYPDWYSDIDLSVVAQELGVANIPIDLS